MYPVLKRAGIEKHILMQAQKAWKWAHVICLKLMIGKDECDTELLFAMPFHTRIYIYIYIHICVVLQS